MRRLDTDRKKEKKKKKKEKRRRKKEKRGRRRNCGMLFVSLLGLFCLLFACINYVFVSLFLWSVCSHEKCVKEVCRLDRRRVLFAKENPM